jgi:hypothetical protein|uniref:Tail fiber protein n=1 Tax=Myoviridae sp. cthmz15 TaxID=2826684 RepID=A0A8S5MH89_9CAUD|nr:MAG TPA: hypothetical protein [Myoviridae sp. cthmz15]
MEDREPLYPGRIKLTPVSGQANVYDSVRADQPVKAGSPLNKNTFLKDTTAALFGKTSAALPDEIFQILANAVLYENGDFSLPNGDGIQQLKVGSGSYVGDGSPTKSLTFPVLPEVLIINGNGAWGNGLAVLIKNSTTGVSVGGYGSATVFEIGNVSWGENTVSWEKGTHAFSSILNDDGETYYYSYFYMQ